MKPLRKTPMIKVSHLLFDMIYRNAPEACGCT